ncbi:MAG TPA: hypothetical protein VGV14_18885 [Rhodanobacter sp.]|nr:hypothetical protein [Rhodanobacter sp.]
MERLTRVIRRPQTWKCKKVPGTILQVTSAYIADPRYPMPVINQNMSEKITYKYRWRFMPLAWLLIFIPFSIFMGVTWIFRQGWQGGTIFLFISLSFVLLVGCILTMGLANITIDDEGISRVVLGVTLQRINWINLEKLHISNSKNPEDGKPVLSYVFVSSKGVGHFLSRRIIFQERKEGMDTLLKKIKSYVTQYNVPIVNISHT